MEKHRPARFRRGGNRPPRLLHPALRLDITSAEALRRLIGWMSLAADIGEHSSLEVRLAEISKLTADARTNRPFTFSNPVENIRKFSARQVREEQDAKSATTSPADLLRLFSVLMRWRGGVLVRTYLNTHTQDEGGEFFRTIPDLIRRRTVLASKPKTKPVRHLKVV